MNRYGALKVAAREIPDAYQALRNFYQHPIRAIYNGKEFVIEEGTIQGCPLSTAIYDLGIQPFGKEMKTEAISQIWVVDDLAAAGKPEDLKEWYDKMKKNGPKYGYKMNKNKSYILAKDDRILKPFEEDIKKE